MNSVTFMENKTKRFLGTFFYVHLHMQAINNKNLLHEKPAKYNSV